MATSNTRPAEYKRAFKALTALCRRYPHGPTAAQKTIATPDEHESFPKPLRLECGAPGVDALAFTPTA